MIKTYRSPWANASFGGPGPTPARDAAEIEAAHQVHPARGNTVPARSSPRGWLELHGSGTSVKLTQSGAELFA